MLQSFTITYTPLVHLNKFFNNEISKTGHQDVATVVYWKCDTFSAEKLILNDDKDCWCAVN